ncbi:alpha-1,4-glucan branching enzyme [Hypoxylon texense]
MEMDQMGIEGPGTDASLNFDLDLNFNVDDLAIDDGDFMPVDPVVDFDSSSGRHSSENYESDRPYHTKRPHKKSRAGCQQCKKRKVKCDEVRPTCKACRLRKEKCIYPTAQASDSQAVSAKSPYTPPSPASSYSSREVSTIRSVIVSEPLYRPREVRDNLDMKMLWFFTTHGYHFFSIQTGRSMVVDHILQVKLVQHAFESPFLMDCLMAVSSLHLQSLGQPIPLQRALAYRTKAFTGYRKAIENADPQDFPALIATSLLMIAVSSQMFREPDGKPLYIIDWMQVWRGIGLIVEIVSPRVLQESGMAVLFYRPPVDLGKATSYIPNNLLFMVASIQPGDTDDGHQQTYYDMLKYLGSLYQELKDHGFNPILDLRILSFFTFIPKAFVPFAQEHRPRALIMLAHYLCFAKLCPDVWWMQGIADREIRQICKEVGDEWGHLLRVPQMVEKTRNKVEIAQLIVDNRDWTPTEMEEYEKALDPRVATDPKLVDNEGTEIEIFEGQFRYKTVINSRELTDAEVDDALYKCFDRGASSTDATSSPSLKSPHTLTSE